MVLEVRPGQSLSAFHMRLRRSLKGRGTVRRGNPSAREVREIGGRDSRRRGGVVWKDLPRLVRAEPLSDMTPQATQTSVLGLNHDVGAMLSIHKSSNLFFLLAFLITKPFHLASEADER